LTTTYTTDFDGKPGGSMYVPNRSLSEILFCENHALYFPLKFYFRVIVS